MPSARRHEQTRARAAKPRRRWRWPLLVLASAALGLVVVGAVAMAQLGVGPAALAQALGERTPMELIGHAQQRLIGHPKLEALLGSTLNSLRDRLVREPVALLPDLAKGRRPLGLSAQRYDNQGLPVAASPLAQAARPPSADRVLTRAEEIGAAMEEALPGQVLEIAPGRYALAATLRTGRAGSADRPITLRASQPGTVMLQVRAVEGAVVNQPYWIFENLDWMGVCPSDDACEHALHVVGAARATVVRNNRITDFSAHIKVNGERGVWPDHGLAQFNTLLNTRPRRGSAPVALVDLVAASGWQILDNHLQGFVKDGGDGVSYGMFMKGAGRGGRIERNLVVCTPRGVTQPGLRVGISIGNGGTGAAYCRDGRCETEHEAALVANNVVAHCNDAGIDIAKGRDALVVHNTLINTQGVLVRNPPSNATLANNLLDSGWRSREGTQVNALANLREGNLKRWIVQPDALDLRWSEVPATVPVHPAVPQDFCARRRTLANLPGAGSAAC